MQSENPMLHSRYEIRREIGRDASIIRYAAHDAEKDADVELRAFFADRIMRQTDTGIEAKPGHEVQYKALASDYEELCGYIMSLPQQAPAERPCDVFSEGGTVWAVYPMLDVQPLADYLARCGTLGYGSMKRAMAPIAGLVGQMHARGILHRGISEQTILVDRQGRFILSGFAVAPARTVGSEIDSTLFFGYSAPEQYSSSSWQGTWTDVYSLGAVCYRLVTGTTPVEWRQRSEKHPLPAPHTLTAALPEYVSDAIMKALQVELAERFRTVDEFWSAVLEEPGGSTIRYVVPEIAKRTDPPGAEMSKKLPWILVGVLALAVLCLAAALLSRHLAEKYIAPPDIYSQSETNESDSGQEEKSEAPQLVVPDFVGANVEEVLLNSLYQQLFDFDIEREYSEEKPAGIVIGQSPDAQTEYSGRITVTLTVSRGSERVTMPDIVGQTYETAVERLAEAEIACEVAYTQDPSAVGLVTAASAPAGSIIYRTRDTVTIWIGTE